ncbi:MAG: amidohydrolase family protein [Saprospiraceae bacterium]|nr:amidohydrolase family protein [Saprospiraceae bacterium]
MKQCCTLLLLLLSSIAISQTTVLHCGQLLDVTTGKVLKDQTVTIEGNKIVSVSKGYQSGNDQAMVVDLKDMLVLPGLIDMHVHLEGQSSPTTYIDRFKDEPEMLALKAYHYGHKTLMAGFTSVRDLGGSGANNAVRDAVNKGMLEGPRIFSVRKSIAITGGHADPTNGRNTKLQGKPSYQDGVCDGAEECAKAVRWQIKNGADWIKITATGGVLSVAKDGDGPAFSEEELEAIVQSARDRGVQVAAHAHGKEGMLRAVKAGVKTIEHGTYMDEEVMREMIKRDAYFVPTITAGWAVARNADKEGYYPEVVRPKAKRIGPLIQETFGKAYKFGVPIAFGTDAGVFDHGFNAKEFELMHEMGMPMIEAIQSATITNAKVLRMEDQLGSIEAGKLADIIAVSPNALEDPTEMMEVVFVMKNGKVVKGE